MGETFKFKADGRREGLLKNKEAYLVITSGGTKLNSSEDFLTPWLKFILNFFGIENEVSGGLSTLVDGFTVTEQLKKDFPDYYKILTEIKVRFQFIDQSVVLEGWAEMIKLDEFGEFKQVRFSPRLDFVPLMDKERLELYYSARKKISELYNSDNYRIEFKLQTGDLLMMDNYRLLHGRTNYDANEGNRFLQGCYIDYDSTEGKFGHLKRKFNL